MMAWLIAFLALFATDVCWAVYVGQVKDNRPLTSAGWAVALFLLGSVAVLGYVKDPWLLLPSAAGALAGTYAGVVWNRRSAGPQTQ